MRLTVLTALVALAVALPGAEIETPASEGFQGRYVARGISGISGT